MGRIPTHLRTRSLRYAGDIFPFFFFKIIKIAPFSFQIYNNMYWPNVLKFNLKIFDSGLVIKTQHNNL